MNLSQATLKKIGVIPVIALAALIAIMLIFRIGENNLLESPLLLLALNIAFLTVSGLVVAVISARSYLTEGSTSLLLLGMATTAGGLAASVAGFGALLSVNENVAIFNSGFLFSGGLQLLSAILIVTESTPSRITTRKMSLIIGYLGVCSVIATISALVIFGFAPVFFTATGPTIIRQWIIGAGTLFFAVSSLLFGWQYLQSKSQVLFWYSGALAFLAIALFGTATYTTPNGVFNWIARLTQYIAGFYFLAAVLTTRGKNASVNEGFSGRWAESFKSDRKQLETLFGNMLNAFAYCKIVTDETGKPVDWITLDVNEAYERIRGFKKRDAIGKRITKLLPGIENDPEDWIGIYGKVALTGEPIRFEKFLYPVKKWYNVSAYSPKKGYFISIFEDITERKKAEEELRQTSSYLDNLLNYANAPIIVWDPEFRITLFNHAFERVTGLSSIEVVGYPLDILFAENRKEEAMAHIKRTLEGEHWESVEIPILHKNGTARTLLWNSANIYDDNGEKIVATIAQGNDITERKQLENTLENNAKNLEKLVEERTKALKNAERLAAIGATAGMVGHDIRNPLQAITSDVYLAGSEVASLPENEQKKNIKESLDEISKSVEYVNKIVADLQDYARPLKPVVEETDLKDLVKNLLIRSYIPSNIKVSNRIEKNAEKIVTDPAFLKRVLGNLVSNAVQAMPDGGKLFVHAYKDSEHIAVKVQDTGVGISEEAKEKLFTPLFTTKSKGQGFGLAVVKRLTETIGGTVTFETQIGKGTTFTIKFPVAQKQQ